LGDMKGAQGGGTRESQQDGRSARGGSDRRYDALKAAALSASFLLFFFDGVHQLLAPAAALYAAALSADLYSTRHFLRKGEKESHPVMAHFLKCFNSFGRAATATLLTWELPGIALLTAVLMAGGRPASASLPVILAALASVHAAAAARNFDLLE
jgi:hypothetical protein